MSLIPNKKHNDYNIPETFLNKKDTKSGHLSNPTNQIGITSANQRRTIYINYMISKPDVCHQASSESRVLYRAGKIVTDDLFISMLSKDSKYI